MGEGSGEASMGRVAFASFIGTAIEFYDFYIYGTAAALAFATVFVPEGLAGSRVAQLPTYAGFAVAFVARPVGGAVLGHFGDRVGRKTMLIFSLLMMGLATFLIGCLPGYASIGVAAPILLAVLRFVQGFGLGGEWGGPAGDRARHPRQARPLLQLSADGAGRRVPGGERALYSPGEPALGRAVRGVGLAGAVPVQHRASRGRALREGLHRRDARLPAGDGDADAGAGAGARHGKGLPEGVAARLRGDLARLRALLHHNHVLALLRDGGARPEELDAPVRHPDLGRHHGPRRAVLRHPLRQAGEAQPVHGRRASGPPLGLPDVLAYRHGRARPRHGGLLGRDARVRGALRPDGRLPAGALRDEAALLGGLRQLQPRRRARRGLRPDTRFIPADRGRRVVGDLALHRAHGP